MPLVNRLTATENSHALFAEDIHPTSYASGLKSVFAGRNGLRVGWRLIIFVALIVTLLGSSLLIRNGGVQGFREAQKHAGEITVTPPLMIESEAIAFSLLCAATFTIAKIEHRNFSEHGLRLRRILGKDFWIGAGSGFLAISGTLLMMFLLHGFHIIGVALHGMAILSSLIAWGFAFLLAGMTEEFLCRGYVQHTLASGIGFLAGVVLDVRHVRVRTLFQRPRDRSRRRSDWFVRSSFLPIFIAGRKSHCGRLSCSLGLGTNALRSS